MIEKKLIEKPLASPIASAPAMKKISDDSKIDDSQIDDSQTTKAARAKAAKKADTAGRDAIPSEGFAITAAKASASGQDSEQIDTNGKSPDQPAGKSAERSSAMAKPAEGIAPSNSIRRHAINRAPNFQPSYPPVTQSSDRIAIFIDGSNLFYAASHLNIEVDYRRLLTTLVRGRRLLRAYFYTGVDPQNEKQRGFLLWLNRHGHRVVSKELVQLPDGSRKANMHVEMAVDMMRISEYCSTLTLLGGDGNLSYALEVLSQRGISIEVVSLQSMTSDSLIDLADSYTDLADLRDEIKR
jgi:uncharacterized LabA/DUF88 family protein